MARAMLQSTFFTWKFKITPIRTQLALLNSIQRSSHSVRRFSLSPSKFIYVLIRRITNFTSMTCLSLVFRTSDRRIRVERSAIWRWSVSYGLYVYVSFKITFLYFIFLKFYSVNITFIDKEGVRRPIRGKIGDNVLYLAHRHGIPLEGTQHDA